MSDYKKLSSEIIHNNPWWRYKHDKFALPDGTEGDYYYGETFGNAIIVPVLDDGRLILVRQYRYLTDKYSIEFPGGMLGEGEAAADAANRELLEETGYKTDNLIKIGEFEPNAGGLKDTSHVFIANELTHLQPPHSDGVESTEILYRRVDEFADMIKRGEIWEGQALATWALARELVLNLTSGS